MAHRNDLDYLEGRSVIGKLVLIAGSVTKVVGERDGAFVVDRFFDSLAGFTTEGSWFVWKRGRWVAGKGEFRYVRES